MSVQRFFHKRFRIGGHKWLPTVHQSVVDPLDGGREISYRAIRKCALCGCIDKDWRIVDGSETRIERPAFKAHEQDVSWPLGLVGLLLKPLAIVVLLVLLVVNALSVSIGSVRSLFGMA